MREGGRSRPLFVYGRAAGRHYAALRPAVRRTGRGRLHLPCRNSDAYEKKDLHGDLSGAPQRLRLCPGGGASGRHFHTREAQAPCLPRGSGGDPDPVHGKRGQGSRRRGGPDPVPFSGNGGGNLFRHEKAWRFVHARQPEAARRVSGDQIRKVQGKDQG